MLHFSFTPQGNKPLVARFMVHMLDQLQDIVLRCLLERQRPLVYIREVQPYWAGSEPLPLVGQLINEAPKVAAKSFAACARTCNCKP